MKLSKYCSRLLFVVSLLSFTLVNHAFSGEKDDAWLMKAVQDRGVKNVQHALTSGANPSYAEENGKYHVLEAALWSLFSADTESETKDAITIIKILVRAGALKSDKELLYLPVAYGSVHMVDYFIKNGANVSSRVDGLTLPEIAIQHSHDDVYHLLIKEGAVPVSATSAAILRLNHAASMFNIDAMKMQLSAGADINGITSNGENPLAAALKSPELDGKQFLAIEWLLKNKADPNKISKGIDGELPLNLAIRLGSYPAKKQKNSKRAYIANDIVKILLANGAKVSSVDANGNTPLHIASKMDHIEAAKTLVKEGAKIMPKNNAGKTPLDLAESKQMIILLKASGAKE